MSANMQNLITIKAMSSSLQIQAHFQVRPELVRTRPDHRRCLGHHAGHGTTGDSSNEASHRIQLNQICPNTISK
jgi:hypothetical protein